MCFAAEDRVLTVEEIVPILERGARDRRQMTAQQMIDGYKAGKLREPCEVMDLLGMAFLLPEDHPLYAPLG